MAQARRRRAGGSQGGIVVENGIVEDAQRRVVVLVARVFHVFFECNGHSRVWIVIVIAHGPFVASTVFAQAPQLE